MADQATGPLAGRRVAVLATNGVEQQELLVPVRVMREAGAEVVVVAPAAGTIQGFEHLERGETIPVDCALEEAKAEDFHGLVLPGGMANPDELRSNERAVGFVRDFLEADKPVAAIHHAAWLLVETGLVKGRTLTSWPSLRTDILNAGGEWVDRPVMVDQKLVTSRGPGDLPQFCDRLVAAIATAAAESRLDNMIEQSFPASDPLPGPLTVTGSGPSEEATAG